MFQGMHLGGDIGLDDPDQISESARDIGGAVRAAIADDDDFQLPGGPIPEQGLESAPDDGGFIVGRDDDRQQLSGSFRSAPDGRAKTPRWGAEPPPRRRLSAGRMSGNHSRRPRLIFPQRRTCGEAETEGPARGSHLPRRYQIAQGPWSRTWTSNWLGLPGAARIRLDPGRPGGRAAE